MPLFRAKINGSSYEPFRQVPWPGRQGFRGTSNFIKYMKNIAPDIMRKRLLVEAYYTIDVSEQAVRDFLLKLPEALSLRVYSDPTIHFTSGQGKEENQGYDGFIPLIDSGIYIGVWANKKFISSVIYTCKDFSTEKAIEFTKDFFQTTEIEFKEF